MTQPVSETPPADSAEGVPQSGDEKDTRQTLTPDSTTRSARVPSLSPAPDQTVVPHPAAYPEHVGAGMPQVRPVRSEDADDVPSAGGGEVDDVSGGKPSADTPPETPGEPAIAPRATAAVATASPTTADGPDGAPVSSGGPYADVYAGTNHGTMIGQFFEAVERLSGAPLPPQWVDQELADYVPVTNEAELARQLQDDRVVVLIADHFGSGRWTTALRLLTTLPSQPRTLRRIRREPGDAFSTEGIRGHKRTGWILDLRDPDDSIPATCDFGLELRHIEDLIADDSHLLVLISTRLWHQIGHGAGHLAHTPQPPAQTTLFTALLQSAGIEQAKDFATDHRLTEQLANLRPGQVKEHAHTLIRAAHHYRSATGRGITPGSAGFEAVVEAACNATSGWMDVLATWHSHPQRTSYDRNYLLLTAVYDGEPIDSVHTKISSLAQAFDEKEPAGARPKGQQGPGLIQLARQIEADPLPDGRLRFPGPGFAEAIVRYFWRDRPELITAFTRWTAKLCLELGKKQGTQLAERMIPWALHDLQASRSTKLLRQVADDWAQEDALAPHAHDLLVAAILDPQTAQLVKNATDRWTGQQDTSPSLLRTLAHVFQTLTPAQPALMLRRLGTLASSQKPGVADAVGEALNTLFSSEKLRPQVRQTLDSWFTSNDRALQHAAASAFVHLAAQRDPAGTPSLLPASDAAAAPWVVRGWRTALETEKPSSAAHDACAVWLDAATTRPDTTEHILSTLVRSVHDTTDPLLRGQRFLNLVRMAERWLIQGGDTTGLPDRERVHSALMRRTKHADPHHKQGSEEDVPTGD
ncbi:hypothetical protein [Streptomyces viridosporus]|uniref:hypothetical protein n=1 Tax=Streptomyces viridosporus TaxID=67581 RepID=UPI00333470BD